MSSVSSVSSVSSPSVSTDSFDSDTSQDSSEGNIQCSCRFHSRFLRARTDPFQKYDRGQFKARFRLSKQAVLFLYNKIQIHLTPQTLRSFSISAMEQILITLRFYASGTFLLTVGDFLGVSKSSVSRIVHRVSHHIALLRNEYISMPSTVQERNTSCNSFYEIARFPNVCGVIDCTHIQIQSPGQNIGERFRNRKTWFSFNVQVVADAKLRIMDIVARYAGSTHDSTIFDNSRIRARFENGEFENTYLLGDSGYACRSYILTPLRNPQTVSESRYNNAHVSTRNTIERTFGVFKRRFPCLKKGIQINYTKVPAVIVSCAVLHNLAIATGDDFIFNEFDEIYISSEDSSSDVNSGETISSSHSDASGNHEIDINLEGNNFAVRTAVINTHFNY